MYYITKRVRTAEKERFKCYGGVKGMKINRNSGT